MSGSDLSEHIQVPDPGLSYIDNESIPSRRMSAFEKDVVKELDPDFEAIEIEDIEEITTEEECDEERIQTYLRIRPSKNSDDELFVERDSQTLAVQSLGNNARKGPNEKNETLFTFSKVLGPKTTQIQVFEECVISILGKFLTSESCLIFGYGATNSGKTHTMQGYGNDFGIVPRTLEYIFNLLEDKLYFRGDMKPHMFNQCLSLSEREVLAMQDVKNKILRESKGKWTQADMQSFSSSLRSSMYGSGASEGSNDVQFMSGSIINSKPAVEKCDIPDDAELYCIWVSFAEIYNEKVYDLFETLTSKRRKEMKLIADKKGQVYIKDLTEVCVSSAAEAYKLFLAGKGNLKFASTEMNANSSRSHCFFSIRIVTVGTTMGNVYPKQVRRLSFCDLAGAERASQTKNIGNRLKESGNINQSLLVLLRCIRAMRNIQQKKSIVPNFIPFRESKLSRLFQSYLTTASHISMIVNINPDPKNLDSTLQVLHNSAIASQVIAFKKVEPPSNDSKFFKKVRESISYGESMNQRAIFAATNVNHAVDERYLCPTVISQSKEKSPDFELANALSCIDNLKSENRRLRSNLEKRVDEVGRLTKLVNVMEQQDKESAEQSEQYQMAVKLINEKRLSMQAKMLQNDHDHAIAVLKGQLDQNQQVSEYDTFTSDDENKENNSFKTPKAMSSSKVVVLKNKKIQELMDDKAELEELVNALRISFDEKHKEVFVLTVKLKDKEQLYTETINNQMAVIKRLEEEVDSTKIMDASVREKQMTAQIVGLNSEIKRITTDNENLRVELQEGQSTCLEYHQKLTEANETNEKLNAALNTALAESRKYKEEAELMHYSYEIMESQLKRLEKAGNVHEKSSTGTSTTPSLGLYLPPARRTNRIRMSPTKKPKRQAKSRSTVSVGSECGQELLSPHST